ncbi:MAG: hypothetical protein MPJ24_06620 [Pirellulaceae bacterium]|nr:hypothetical protein [Pirellulaceae bacterium]
MIAWHLLFKRSDPLSTPLLGLLTLALLIGSGCGRVRPRETYLELLDSEKRALEDQAYELKNENQYLHDLLDSAQRENEALRKSLSTEPSETGTDEIDLIIPDLDIGDTIDKDHNEVHTEFPDHYVDNNSSTNHHINGGKAHLISTRSENDLPADQTVTSIWLNPLLTGGDDRDNRPGDEGIVVVFEPRNQTGQYVPLAGPVSVVLLDPQKEGPTARIARWDFTAEETRAVLGQSALGRGIHLAIPWVSSRPENEKLQLYVRYQTTEGVNLEANREVYIDLPGKTFATWTPMIRKNEERQQPKSRLAQATSLEKISNQLHNGGPNDGPPQQEINNQNRGNQSGNTGLNNPVKVPTWSPFR